LHLLLAGDAISAFHVLIFIQAADIDISMFDFTAEPDFFQPRYFAIAFSH